MKRTAAADFDFDPYSPDFDVDPHPKLAELRERHPVHYWATGKAWLLSRYAECVTALRDPRLSLDVQAWKHAREIPQSPLDSAYENGLFAMPSERHARMRKLLGPSFSPRSIAARRAQIAELVGEALDQLGDAKHFDVTERLAAVIPIRVIGRILGIPRGHEAIFRDYAKGIISGVNPLLRNGLDAKVGHQVEAGRGLLRELIETRRRRRGDDLLSELIEAEEDGDKLTSEELLTVVTSLVIAGAETTTHLITLGLWTLLRHPEALERLRADRKLLPNAVDEMLRYEMFGRLGSPRYALEPIELDGFEIDTGEMIFPMLTAALRDPDRFPDPDRFDIDRDQRFNIAFGQGPHYCLGAALARVEAELAFGALFDRYPRLELIDGPHFEFHPVLRNATSLVIGTGA